MAVLPADPYTVLGVGADADTSAIKTAYRKLVLRCHPDKVQDPTLKAAKQDEFQRVQQAYEILSDETKRREYDEDVKLKRLREELSRGMARSAATPRASPKAYAEPHIRSAEPPPSFKPGPPPTSPYSPYGSASRQFSHSWEHDIPLRTKVVYEEGHRARRTASYEKPRDDHKDERRRRKDDDVHDWVREKEHERERDKARDREREREKDPERDRDRERERERERRSRADRGKDDKKDKARREMEKREKERERARQQDRMKKSPYVEPYDDSDEGRLPKKKTSAGIGTAAAATTAAGGSGSASSGKKHAGSPRRDKSARRDESPRAELNPDNIKGKMKAAAEYIDSSRRRGSKTGLGSSHMPEGVSYSANYPDPNHAWHASSTHSPRSRRPSQEETLFRARPSMPDDDVEVYRASEFRPPRLTKSYTSPAAAMHMPNSSAARIPPPLSRAATTDYARHTPPAAPDVLPPESGRHAPKSERRRRGSFEAYDEEIRPRRSSAQPRILHHQFDGGPPLTRSSSKAHYRHSEDIHYPPPPPESSRRPGFSKIKVTPVFVPEQVAEAKRYSPEDVSYSSVYHSSSQYSYLPVRS